MLCFACQRALWVEIGIVQKNSLAITGRAVSSFIWFILNIADELYDRTDFKMPQKKKKPPKGGKTVKLKSKKIIPHSINRRMGDHFCSLLGSTIICVPRFLRICSLSRICRQHRRDSGSNTSKPVCSLSVRMLYSHTARFLFYSVAAVDSTHCIQNRLTFLCIGLIPFCVYKIA